MNAEVGANLHIVSMVTVIGYKVVLAVIGYLIVRLGYNLLVKGVTGQFEYKGNFFGINAGLVSASPGLLFLLLGVTFLSISVLDESKIKTTIPSENTIKINKPYLPPTPPKIKG